MGWLKKHKKELLGGLGLLGLGATGFGLAGMGPLAGLLSAEAAGTATGAAGLGELASVGATGSTMMGESLSPGLLSGLNWNKGLKGLQMANSIMQQDQPQQQQMMPRPMAQSQPAMSNKELAELYKRLYGGLYV